MNMNTQRNYTNRCKYKLVYYTITYYTNMNMNMMDKINYKYCPYDMIYM